MVAGSDIRIRWQKYIKYVFHSHEKICLNCIVISINPVPAHRSVRTMYVCSTPCFSDMCADLWVQERFFFFFFKEQACVTSSYRGEKEERLVGQGCNAVGYFVHGLHCMVRHLPGEGQLLCPLTAVKAFCSQQRIPVAHPPCISLSQQSRQRNLDVQFVSMHTENTSACL